MPSIIQFGDQLFVEGITCYFNSEDIMSLQLRTPDGVKFNVMLPRTEQEKLSTGNSRSSSTPTTIESAPAVASAALTVHCEDAIRLVAKNDAAKAVLENYGAWWLVHAGYRGGTHWLLNSISKQPRKASSRAYYQLVVAKEHDPNYEIDRVCVSPKEFVYREWAKE